MPISALPDHLKDIENNFPDDSQYSGWFGRIYKWFNKKTKTWFAFSYRCTEPWARWRKYPIILFAIKGKGPWRVEGKRGDRPVAIVLFSNPWYRFKLKNEYLSRIQLWCRWHLAIQWPLMFSFHFYPNKEDVPVYGEPKKDLDGKVWFGYWGHFDSDLIHWMFTSMYLGRNFK